MSRLDFSTRHLPKTSVFKYMTFKLPTLRVTWYKLPSNTLAPTFTLPGTHRYYTRTWRYDRVTWVCGTRDTEVTVKNKSTYSVHLADCNMYDITKHLLRLDTRERLTSRLVAIITLIFIPCSLQQISSHLQKCYHGLEENITLPTSHAHVNTCSSDDRSW